MPKYTNLWVQNWESICTETTGKKIKYCIFFFIFTLLIDLQCTARNVLLVSL